MTDIREGYTRVSEVLAPFSGYGDIDADILDNAASRGTLVHHYCNLILKGEDIFSLKDDINLYARNSEHAMREYEKACGFLNSFEKWYKGFEFIQTPDRFYCDDLMLTGECDLIAKNDSGFTLIDLKTSQRESKTWMLQGSAYSYFAKRLGINITKIQFIKLSNTGAKPKVFEYEENFGLFLHVYETYLYFKDNLDDMKLRNSDLI